MSSESKKPNQLTAITGAAVIRATVGGRVLVLQLSVSKWLQNYLREETLHIGPPRQSVNAARMDTSKGRRQARASLSCFCSSLSLLYSPLPPPPLPPPLPPPPSLLHSAVINMCKCLFSVVWQPLLYGLASVRRAQNIQWLTKPNYPRLLPFHRG